LHLKEIVQREYPPNPWAEGEKIPWNDPGFSQRMLQEHLSQEHDAASRRFEVIDGHIDWIHNNVLSGKPAKILDLGCGPGFYTSRLAELGHQCWGIDFSPASIEYAKLEAKEKKLACEYTFGDIREADYGEGFDLVMLIFGEFNVFRPQDTKRILNKAHNALKEGGIILLEPHTFEAVQMIGEQSSSWYSSETGLFAPNPHINLQENFWIDDSQVTIQRYYILDLEMDQLNRFSSTMQAYTEDGYQNLLAACDFTAVRFYPSLLGVPDEGHQYLLAITAQKLGS